MAPRAVGYRHDGSMPSQDDVPFEGCVAAPNEPVASGPPAGPSTARRRARTRSSVPCAGRSILRDQFRLRAAPGCPQQHPRVIPGTHPFTCAHGSGNSESASTRRSLLWYKRFQEMCSQQPQLMRRRATADPCGRRVSVVFTENGSEVDHPWLCFRLTYSHTYWTTSCSSPGTVVRRATLLVGHA